MKLNDKKSTIIKGRFQHVQKDENNGMPLLSVKVIQNGNLINYTFHYWDVENMEKDYSRFKRKILTFL